MSAEQYLDKKLSQFSVLDLALVKIVYLCISLLICSFYTKLAILDWWFYLAAFLLCATPLYLYLFSLPGSFKQKQTEYVKQNNPSHQMLLFLAMFFFAALICVWFPVLVHIHWWIYTIIAVVCAIKPMKANWIW